MSSAGPPMDPAAAAAAAAAAQAAMLQFTIEAWTLLAIGILVTMLRTYARIKAVGVRGLQADDYLVWVGAVSFIFHGSGWVLSYGVGVTNVRLHRSSTPSRPVLHTRSVLLPRD